MPFARTAERTTAGKSFPRPDARFFLPPMKIAVDAMGGDHAPAEVVRGAVHASREFLLPIVLVGREERMREELRRAGAGADELEVENASEVVEMQDAPGVVLRKKKESSIRVGLNLVASVECKPLHLVQFGFMGEAYARKILGIPRPRVGVLSIGEEETKGTDLTRETAALFRKTGLAFVGNV